MSDTSSMHHVMLQICFVAAGCSGPLWLSVSGLLRSERPAVIPTAFLMALLSTHYRKPDTSVTTAIARYWGTSLYSIHSSLLNLTVWYSTWSKRITVRCKNNSDNIKRYDDQEHIDSLSINMITLAPLLDHTHQPPLLIWMTSNQLLPYITHSERCQPGTSQWLWFQQMPKFTIIHTVYPYTTNNGLKINSSSP